MPDASRDPAVPLADVEVAQRIAEAARGGGPAERTPTVAQLLAAFGEDESGGGAAIARVQRALALAGVGVAPPLDQAAPGSRVTLSPGRRPGASGARRLLPLVLGTLALLAVITGVVLAAGVLGGSDDREGRASSLPVGPTATPTTSTGADVVTPTATTTTTAPGPTEAEKAAEKKRAAADAKAEATRKRKATKRKREAKVAAERKAAAKRQLVVRLVPAEPSYACIVDGAGRRLFEGTLSQRRTLKAKKMRLNIGLSTVSVSVNGKRLRLAGSPSGYLLQVGKAPQSLPLGARPSC